MLQLMPASRWLSRLLVSDGSRFGADVRGYDLCVVGFSLAAIIAAIAAVPGSDQIAYGLISDKKYGDARQMLGDRQRSGARDPHEALALYKLHMRFGDIARADQTLAAAIAANPTRVPLLRTAVQFYEDTHQPKRRAEVLLHLLSVAPERETLNQVLAHLRLFGEHESDVKLLRRLAKSPVLSGEHHRQLGLSFARDGDYPRAVLHLVTAVGSSRRARRPLLRVLLLSRRFDEARALLRNWVSGKMSAGEVLSFYHELRDAKQDGAAGVFIEAAVREGHISRERARQHEDDQRIARN